MRIKATCGQISLETAKIGLLFILSSAYNTAKIKVLEGNVYEGNQIISC